MQRHLLEFPLAGLVRRSVLGFWAGVFKKFVCENLICNLRMSLGIDMPSCNALSGQERAPVSVLLPLGLAPGDAGPCQWRGPRGLFWVYLYMPVVVVVESLSRVWPFTTPWTAAARPPCPAVFWSLLKLMSIESVMPPNCFILFHPLLLLPSIFPSIRVSSSEWPKCWSVNVSIRPSRECPGLMACRTGWLATVFEMRFIVTTVWFDPSISLTNIFWGSACAWNSMISTICNRFSFFGPHS